MATNCNKQAHNGIADTAYFDRRLEQIEVRIDDLCGLLAELLERIDRNGR